jgi:trigger factor
MGSVINRKEKSMVEIVFDIPADIFKESLDRAFRKNAKKFSIPGFRPGKAPMNIVTKYYGEAVLYEDAIEDIAQSSYTEAVLEHALEPVTAPEIGEITEIGSEKGIKFSIHITNKPDVVLGEYEGVKATKRQAHITDEEVEKELNRVRERNSRMVPVEGRSVLSGDTANIDYEGFLDGNPFEGGKGVGHDLEIGSGSFIPGFEEQVIGRSAEEEFEVNVSFPEEYHAENLKGKAVVFKVKLNSVKVKELPEVDDEFAKDVSEFDTLAEYQESLRKNLTESEERKIENEFENAVIEQVVNNASVDVPDIMVDQEADRMIEEQSNRMKYQGISMDQYLQYTGQNIESLKESMKENAERTIKTRLVIEAIGKTMNIEVTPEDIQKEIKSLAEQYKMKEEEIEKSFGTENSFLNDGIIFKKTIEALKATAKPQEKSSEEKSSGKSAKSNTSAKAKKAVKEPQSGLEEKSNETKAAKPSKPKTKKTNSAKEE